MARDNLVNLLRQVFNQNDAEDLLKGFYSEKDTNLYLEKSNKAHSDLTLHDSKIIKIINALHAANDLDTN